MKQIINKISFLWCQTLMNFNELTILSITLKTHIILIIIIESVITKENANVLFLCLKINHCML